MIYDNYEIGQKLGPARTMKDEYSRSPDRFKIDGKLAIVYQKPGTERKAIWKDDSFWLLVEKRVKKLSEEESEKKVKTMLGVVDTPPALVPEESETPTEVAVQRDNEILNQHQAMSIDEAAVIARQLTDIIEKCKLFSMIQGNKYIEVEGWQALDSMIQVSPIVKNTIETSEYIESQVDLINAFGEEIGRGISRCYFEETKKKRDGTIYKRWYNNSGQLNKVAVQSMSQTRAIGKANRNKYAWIIRLAGYSPTPSEEMEGVK